MAEELLERRGRFLMHAVPVSLGLVSTLLPWVRLDVDDTRRTANEYYDWWHVRGLFEEGLLTWLPVAPRICTGRTSPCSGVVPCWAR